MSNLIAALSDLLYPREHIPLYRIRIMVTRRGESMRFGSCTSGVDGSIGVSIALEKIANGEIPEDATLDVFVRAAS